MTATIWNNLGKVRAKQGDWKSASVLFEKAIAVWRKALGPTHPDVALGLTNMAALNQSRKRYPEAERLYRQALEIDETALGADSLTVANDWNNLGVLEVRAGRIAEAREDFRHALQLAPGHAQARANLQHLPPS